MLPSFVYGFFRFSTGFLIPKLEEIYSISDATAGGVVSLSVGSVTIGVFLSGFSARRYGDKNTIILGFLIFAAGIGMIAILDNLYEFIALFLLGSFGGGLTIPASYSLAGRMLPKRKGIGVGFVTSAYNLGGLVGPSSITFLLVSYGWNISFVAFSIVGIAGLLLFWLILGRDEGGGDGPVVRVSMRSLLKNRMIRVLVLADFVADLGFVAYVSWTPAFVTNRFGLFGSSSELVSTFFGLGVGIGGLGALIAGSSFDRLGGRRSALFGGIASALSALGLYLSSSLFLSLGLIVLTGFLSNWFWTLLTAMAQGSVGQDDRTPATSLVQTAGFVGAFIAPGLTGLIGGATSAALILTVSVPYVIYAIVVAGLYRDA
jgi:MFS family permease